jgi:hypothetical protein
MAVFQRKLERVAWASLAPAGSRACSVDLDTSDLAAMCADWEASSLS